MEVRDETLMPQDLETADEAFITSTTRELSPVTSIDDRILGTASPAPSRSSCSTVTASVRSN